MLLEDGATVEGPATDVLAVVFRVQVALLEDLDPKLPRPAAMSIAEIQMARIHDALAAAGYVVRQVDPDV